MLAKELSIGEISKRSGLAVSAIHFYESKGLITSRRNSGNQRRYTAGVLRYLAIVKVAQRVGISLDEVKETLGCYTYGLKLSANEWEIAAKKWRVVLDKRIETLRRLRDELDSCIGCGCMSLEDCPLRNPEDTLSKKGSGAIILERKF